MEEAVDNKPTPDPLLTNIALRKRSEMDHNKRKLIDIYHKWIYSRVPNDRRGWNNRIGGVGRG